MWIYVSYILKEKTSKLALELFSSHDDVIESTLDPSQL